MLYLLEIWRQQIFMNCVRNQSNKQFPSTINRASPRKSCLIFKKDTSNILKNIIIYHAFLLIEYGLSPPLLPDVPKKKKEYGLRYPLFSFQMSISPLLILITESSWTLLKVQTNFLTNFIYYDFLCITLLILQHACNLTLNKHDVPAFTVSKICAIYTSKLCCT